MPASASPGLLLALCVALPITVAHGVPVSAADAAQAETAQTETVVDGVRAGTVPGTDCPNFPRNNYWNSRIDRLPKHKRSRQWRDSIGADDKLHPDFGPSFGEQSLPYGIPVTIVSGDHPRTRVEFQYADESDDVGYPLGSDTLMEGGPESDGDRHAVIVNSDTCQLFETWNTRQRGGTWTAGSGATWSLRSNRLRPSGWTSADAAGLPILPGLLAYDEVAAGKVTHAIRFTAPTTRDRFIWPARHKAGRSNSPKDPPMGARFRLKRNFSTAGWSQEARIILRAMQRYGLVLADNGSGWYFQGTADERWDIELIDELKQIPVSAFEAVNTRKMRVSPNSARAR